MTEFAIFRLYRGFKEAKLDFNPYEQGTAYFTTGQLGERIRPHLDECADRARMSRRDFLRSACGFTAAMLAVNKITGMKFFDVQEAEAYEPAAAIEGSALRKARTDFITDFHTHVAWRRDGFIIGVNTTEKGMWLIDLLDNLGKAMGLPNGIRDITVGNFGKLILQGSDTSVAVIHSLGFKEDFGGKDMVPIEEVGEVRDRYPDQIILMGGGLTPNQGLGETLDRLQRFVEDYKISGLSLYTFDSTPKRGWWFDDEKLAYPLWERCWKLGLKNIGCHKGLPFSQFMARYAHPGDFDAVVDDFPDLNWIVLQSAWPYQNELAALKAFKPHRKNLFCDLSNTFAATVTRQPLECAHILGTLLRDLGTDSVMWGTNSAFWGSPQWQIEAFRRFRIPDQLVAGYGYPQLTDKVKRNVFSENASVVLKGFVSRIKIRDLKIDFMSAPPRVIVTFDLAEMSNLKVQIYHRYVQEKPVLETEYHSVPERIGRSIEIPFHGPKGEYVLLITAYPIRGKPRSVMDHKPFNVK